MGFGVTELLIILAIVLVLFGAKKLRNIGGDLGGAIKNFKTAMNEEENPPAATAKNTDSNPAQLKENTGNVIEANVEQSKNKEQV